MSRVLIPLLLFASTTVLADPVAAVPPAFSKSFAPAAILPGGTSTLTFTIDSTANAVAVSSLDFVDMLPAGVVIASPSNAGTSCSGGILTATPGTDLISLRSGTVAAASSCTVTADVTSSTPGTHVNTSGPLTSDSGMSASATAPLMVAGPLGFAKSFAPTVIAMGGVSTLTFTIDNTANALALGNLAFSDTLPADLTVATPSNAATSCTGGTLGATSGTNLISYSAGSVAAMMACSVAVDVTSSTAGVHTNRSEALQSDVGTSLSAVANLIVLLAPALTKSFSPPAIPAGSTSTLTFTIDNTANSVAVANLAFTDTLPADLVIATPSNAAKSCTGGTLVATAGTTLISYSGGSVEPFRFCTVTVDVTSSTLGIHTNTSSTLTSDGGTGAAATADLAVVLAPGFSKSFAPSTIASGGVSTLTFTVDSTANAAAVGSLGFSDNLPPGILVATPLNTAASCSGGTLVAVAGTGTVSYSGGSAAAGASCSVTVDVTSTVPSVHTNTSGALSSDGGTSASATADLTVQGVLGFSMSFAPASISPGEAATLTFVIDNTAHGGPAGNLDFTNVLPLEIVMATPSSAAVTCTGGTLTAPGGGSTLTYAGGAVAANATCEVTVGVTSAVPGIHTATSGVLTSDFGSSGTATADLAVASITIPALSPGGLVALASLLLAAALLLLRRAARF